MSRKYLCKIFIAFKLLAIIEKSTKNSQLKNKLKKSICLTLRLIKIAKCNKIFRKVNVKALGAVSFSFQ